MWSCVPALDLRTAVQKTLLVKLAENVPPDWPVYKPCDIIDITCRRAAEPRSRR
jgi:hypothetical protein